VSDENVDLGATQPSRRWFLTGGVAAVIAAPSIVRVSSLMGMPRAPLELYGRSPAMEVLSDVVYFQNRLWVFQSRTMYWIAA